MDWIIGHQAELLGIISSSAVIGGIIVKLTPTKTDDKWWGWLMKFFGKFLGKSS